LQAGGLASNGPGSSELLSRQAHQTTLSESSKFSSGAVGSSLGRPNDDYLASRGYAPKLDQYSADYELDRRVYGEHSANIGRRDGLNDLERRYPDHIPGSHQVSLSLFLTRTQQTHAHLFLPYKTSFCSHLLRALIIHPFSLLKCY
jgi:hypothetical protein